MAVLTGALGYLKHRRSKGKLAGDDELATSSEPASGNLPQSSRLRDYAAQRQRQRLAEARAQMHQQQVQQHQQRRSMQHQRRESSQQQRQQQQQRLRAPQPLHVQQQQQQQPQQQQEKEFEVIQSGAPQVVRVGRMAIPRASINLSAPAIESSRRNYLAREAAEEAAIYAKRRHRKPVRVQFDDELDDSQEQSNALSTTAQKGDYDYSDDETEDDGSEAGNDDGSEAEVDDEDESDDENGEDGVEEQSVSEVSQETGGDTEDSTYSEDSGHHLVQEEITEKQEEKIVERRDGSPHAKQTISGLCWRDSQELEEGLDSSNATHSSEDEADGDDETSYSFVTAHSGSERAISASNSPLSLHASPSDKPPVSPMFLDVRDRNPWTRSSVSSTTTKSGQTRVSGVPAERKRKKRENRKPSVQEKERVDSSSGTKAPMRAEPVKQRRRSPAKPDKQTQSSSTTDAKAASADRVCVDDVDTLAVVGLGLRPSDSGKKIHEQSQGAEGIVNAPSLEWIEAQRTSPTFEDSIVADFEPSAADVLVRSERLTTGKSARLSSDYVQFPNRHQDEIACLREESVVRQPRSSSSLGFASQYIPQRHLNNALREESASRQPRSSSSLGFASQYRPQKHLNNALREESVSRQPRSSSSLGFASQYFPRRHMNQGVKAGQNSLRKQPSYSIPQSVLSNSFRKGRNLSSAFNQISADQGDSANKPPRPPRRENRNEQGLVPSYSNRFDDHKSGNRQDLTSSDSPETVGTSSREDGLHEAQSRPSFQSTPYHHPMYPERHPNTHGTGKGVNKAPQLATSVPAPQEETGTNHKASAPKFGSIASNLRKKIFGRTKPSTTERPSSPRRPHPELPLDLESGALGRLRWRPNRPAKEWQAKIGSRVHADSIGSSTQDTPPRSTTPSREMWNVSTTEIDVMPPVFVRPPSAMSRTSSAPGEPGATAGGQRLSMRPSFDKQDSGYSEQGASLIRQRTAPVQAKTLPQLPAVSPTLDEDNSRFQRQSSRQSQTRYATGGGELAPRALGALRLESPLSENEMDSSLVDDMLQELRDQQVKSPEPSSRQMEQQNGIPDDNGHLHSELSGRVLHNDRQQLPQERPGSALAFPMSMDRSDPLPEFFTGRNSRMSSDTNRPRAFSRISTEISRLLPSSRISTDLQRPMPSSRISTDLQRPMPSSRISTDMQRPMPSSRISTDMQRPMPSSRISIDVQGTQRHSKEWQRLVFPSSNTLDKQKAMPSSRISTDMKRPMPSSRISTDMQRPMPSSRISTDVQRTQRPTREWQRLVFPSSNTSDKQKAMPSSNISTEVEQSKATSHVKSDVERTVPSSSIGTDLPRNMPPHTQRSEAPQETAPKRATSDRRQPAPPLESGAELAMFLNSYRMSSDIPRPMPSSRVVPDATGPTPSSRVSTEMRRAMPSSNANAGPSWQAPLSVPEPWKQIFTSQNGADVRNVTAPAPNNVGAATRAGPISQDNADRSRITPLPSSVNSSGITGQHIAPPRTTAGPASQKPSSRLAEPKIGPQTQPVRKSFDAAKRVPPPRVSVEFNRPLLQVDGEELFQKLSEYRISLDVPRPMPQSRVSTELNRSRLASRTSSDMARPIPASRFSTEMHRPMPSSRNSTELSRPMLSSSRVSMEKGRQGMPPPRTTSETSRQQAPPRVSNDFARPMAPPRISEEEELNLRFPPSRVEANARPGKASPFASSPSDNNPPDPFARVSLDEMRKYLPRMSGEMSRTTNPHGGGDPSSHMNPSRISEETEEALPTRVSSDFPRPSVAARLSAVTRKAVLGENVEEDKTIVKGSREVERPTGVLTPPLTPYEAAKALYTAAQNKFAGSDSGLMPFVSIMENDTMPTLQRPAALPPTIEEEEAEPVCKPKLRPLSLIASQPNSPELGAGLIFQAVTLRPPSRSSQGTLQSGSISTSSGFGSPRGSGASGASRVISPSMRAVRQGTSAGGSAYVGLGYNNPNQSRHTRSSSNSNINRRGVLPTIPAASSPSARASPQSSQGGYGGGQFVGSRPNLDVIRAAGASMPGSLIAPPEKHAAWTPKSEMPDTPPSSKLAPSLLDPDPSLVSLLNANRRGLVLKTSVPYQS